MRLKVPKTERRKSTDSTGRRIFRRILLVGIAVILLGLSGTHLLAVITKNDALNGPGNAVSGIMSTIPG